MRFDFAISFAGPSREIARELAGRLQLEGFSVFFDELFEHEMLGRDGADYLNNVFFSESELCVALVSTAYEERAWAQLERRAAQARELGEGPGVLIPILCDDVRPKWLLPTRVFFDLRSRGLERLVELLAKRVQSHPGGGYRVVTRLESPLEDDTMALSSVPGAREFLAWSTFQPSPIRKPLHVRQAGESSNWQASSLPCPARARHLFLIGDRLIIVPENSADPIEIVHLRTNVRQQLIVPRKSKWNSVTDCKCRDSSLLLSYCGGDVWLVDIAKLHAIQLREGSDDVVYGHADWLDSRTVASGNDQSLTVAIHEASDGKIVATFDTEEPAMAVGCLPAIGRLVVGGEGSVQVYAPDGALVQKHEVMHGVFDLVCAKRGGIYGFTTGFPSPGNVLEVWDASTGLRVLKERSDRSGGWSRFALSDDGTAFCVLVGRNELRVYEHAS